MNHDTAIEVARVSPAAAGATYATVTANEIIAWVTLVYVIVNLLYILRKWYFLEKRKDKDDGSTRH